jgi:hypothetical protein
MPVPVLKKYAEESGKTLDEAEEAWDSCKLQADKAFDKGQKDDAYWPYVQICTQRKLGIEKKREAAKKAAKKK